MVRSIRFRWAGCGVTLSGRMSQKAPKEKRTYFKILVRRLSVLRILLHHWKDLFTTFPQAVPFRLLDLGRTKTAFSSDRPRRYIFCQADQHSRVGCRH